MSASAATKTCLICGQDCSSRPRVKDPQGRYTCKACLEKTQAAKPPKAAIAATAAARHTAPAPADDAGVLSKLIDDSVKQQGPPCDTCGSPMKADQVVCVRCGFNRILGKAAKTSVVAATREKSSGGQTASKAVGVATSILITSNPIAWAVGGAMGGAIGAVIWAAIAYNTHREYGWIAIGVGVLSGLGTALVAQGNAGPFSGGLAAIIAVISIFAGRYAAVSMIIDDALGDRPRQITVSSERALIYYARDYASEREADGQLLNWPEDVDAETASAQEDFPRDVWTAAERRWNSGTPEFRENYRKEREADVNAELAAIKQTGFMATFDLLDVGFILFAVLAAYGAGSGGDVTG